MVTLIITQVTKSHDPLSKGSFKGSFKDSFEGSFKGSIGVDPRTSGLPGTGKAHHIGALIIRIGVPLKGFP